MTFHFWARMIRAQVAGSSYDTDASRQRVNESLAALQAQGAIRIEYGGLRVLDLEALR